MIKVINTNNKTSTDWHSLQRSFKQHSCPWSGRPMVVWKGLGPEGLLAESQWLNAMKIYHEKGLFIEEEQSHKKAQNFYEVLLHSRPPVNQHPWWMLLKKILHLGLVLMWLLYCPVSAWNGKCHELQLHVQKQFQPQCGRVYPLCLMEVSLTCAWWK